MSLLRVAFVQQLNFWPARWPHLPARPVYQAESNFGSGNTCSVEGRNLEVRGGQAPGEFLRSASSLEINRLAAGKSLRSQTRLEH